MAYTWQPEVSDVAALLRARTKDNLGNEVGTFNEDTRPTEDNVQSLISQAADFVASQLGVVEGSDDDTLCNASLTDDAKGSVALYAAMLIELSYFPEQVGSDRSPYSQYRDMFDGRIKQLRESVAEECGQGSGSEGVSGQLPDYDFEASTRSLGREIVW